MIEVPDSLAHLPRDRNGLPVPWTASWSSEHWATARAEARIDNRLCLFTAGRPGRGTPILGAMNEPRQREAMLEGLCQVCGRPLDEDRWLPLLEWHAHTDSGIPVTSDPPCHLACAKFTLIACPVLAQRGGRIVRLGRTRLLAQLVDPSRAPSRKHLRFDADEDPHRERLGGIVERLGPLVGLLKMIVFDFEENGEWYTYEPDSEP